MHRRLLGRLHVGMRRRGRSKLGLAGLCRRRVGRIRGISRRGVFRDIGMPGGRRRGLGVSLVLAGCETPGLATPGVDVSAGLLGVAVFEPGP